MGRTYGWDLGGANLKVAEIEDGRVLSVAQIPCPVIPDPAKFNQALDAALKACPGEGRHAVTMTGELSDVFPSRAAGVAYLVGLMRKTTGEDTLFYSLRDGLIGADAVRDNWQAVASANWHASAALAASLVDERAPRLALPCAAEITFGVGVHFGDVVFGNAGTAERLKFGVIGRAVNEVARNQDMTKLLGQPVIVSDAVADRTAPGQDYRLQSLGMHDLRGIPTARRLWALRA